MINTVFAGLNELYLFPEYNTREAYEAATGKPCPPYDPTKPIKHWEDPAPKTMGRYVLYENILATDEHNNILADESGRPFFEPQSIPVALAKTVNIPEKRAGNEPGLKFVIHPPCRKLEGDEELVFQPGVPFRVPVVYRPSLMSVDEPVAWTNGDRELLRRIAAKLGV
mgnify:CR=1 FL=1